MIRLAWDRIWMDLAVSLAKRSTCSRAQVGCVIVSWDNTRVLSVGYNGNARGFPNACDLDTPGSCGCLHAEENACIKMDFSDCTAKVMYTTVSPCLMCAKRIINAGIQEVVYHDPYRLPLGIEMLEKSAVTVRQFS